jgi:N-sulfoglucosamine sulfohydrolase
MRLLTLCVVAITAVLTPRSVHAQEQPRNVLLLIADDLGLDLGCYGNNVIKMPHLDGLAKRGVRFARAYATVASCSPSRSTIFSGLYTHQNGMYGLAHPPHSQTSHNWVMSLPRLLRQAGYFTGIIGKVHVTPAAVYNFEKELVKGAGRNNAMIAKYAREFITESGKRPFFLTVGFIDPHRAKVGFDNEKFDKDDGEVRYDPRKVIVPPHLPDRPEVRQDLAEYYQSASRMDRGVGMVLKALEESGQLDNTLIIFLSDNGIPFPGAKTTLYAAGVHLPLLVAGPGVPAGRVNNGLASWVDVAPTVLDWCKAKGPSYQLPGKSLLPILSDDNPKDRDAVFGSHQMHEITMSYPMRSITTRTHKLIVNLDNTKDFPLPSDLWASPSWQGIRTRGDKMMGQRAVADFLRRPREELFDLTKDPHELRNLANDPAHASILAELRQRLRDWQDATNDPWTILYREEKASYNR